MENQLKTGTTTVGLLCKDCVVLAADRRATAGTFISNKKYTKIVEISDKMALTVAGTVSDVQLLIKIIKAQIRLSKVRTGREMTVNEVANVLAGMVYSNIRKLSLIPGFSHFLLGGKDATGFHLFDLYPDGSVTEVDDFVSSGSGSVMAYGVLETLYKKDMSADEGVRLAAKSLNAALQRDSASGDGFDIVVITKGGIKKAAAKQLEAKVEA